MCMCVCVYICGNGHRYIPTTKTEIPSRTGSIFSPEITAKWWAPTPNEPAKNVAIPLFTPFPSVAPAKILNKEINYHNALDLKVK